MSAHVLLNQLNELGKRDEISFFATSFIHAINQEHER